MTQLRAAFFVFLFLNLCFFVWSQGLFGNTGSNREPQRMNKQIAPEELRISNPLAAKTAPAP